MAKRYTVTIEYKNGRKNWIVEWADNEDEAKKRALREWGNPTIYSSVTIKEGW